MKPAKPYEPVYDVCETCGALVAEWMAHAKFHDALEQMRAKLWPEPDAKAAP